VSDRLRRPGLLVGVLSLLACLTACGSSAGSQAKVAVVKAQDISGSGTVLVNSSGHALYIFVPDARRAVTCVQSCAGIWPPLYTKVGSTPVAGSGVSAALLGTDHDGGKAVATYDGWPLYTYTDDVSAGTAAGQALDLNGGYWYLMQPSGTPLVPPGSPPVPS